MVCPLRFVLVGASAIVAILAVAYTRLSTEDPKERASATSKRQEQSIWRTVLDMFTGRYLWQTYLDWRDSPATHEDGMTTQPGKQA